jgi:hypothetical protein
MMRLWCRDCGSAVDGGMPEGGLQGLWRDDLLVVASEAQLHNIQNGSHTP